MKNVSIVVLLVACGGCGDSIRHTLYGVQPWERKNAPPPTVTAPPSVAARDADEQRRMAQADADREATEKAAAERKAAADAIAKANSEALEQSCAASRAERVADVKKEVHDWAVVLEKLAPFEKWTTTHCKEHVDTRGVEVSRERTGVGKVVVRTKEVGKEDDMTCDAPLPPGMTMWKVRKILDAHEDDSSEAPVIYEGRFVAENRECVVFDRAAGFDWFVRMYDFDGMKRILGGK